jgi:hypothetical protein
VCDRGFSKPKVIARHSRGNPFSLEEKRIRACPERSAELPLKLCRRIRILEKPNCNEGGEE